MPGAVSMGLHTRSGGFNGNGTTLSLFYVSDIFVARQRFVARQHINRLVGLPLYYAGQFMIAFSIRFL